VEAEIGQAAQRGYHRSLAEFSPDLLGVALPLPLAARRLSIVIAGPMFRCVDRLDALAGMLRNGIRDVRRHLPQ
jgi:DNA-binding IclR family transcriptional regulator